MAGASLQLVPLYKVKIIKILYICREKIILIKTVVYLKLNLLQNGGNDKWALIANLHQPNCLWDTETSGGF